MNVNNQLYSSTDVGWFGKDISLFKLMGFAYALTFRNERQVRIDW